LSRTNPPKTFLSGRLANAVGLSVYAIVAQSEDAMVKLESLETAAPADDSEEAAGRAPQPN